MRVAVADVPPQVVAAAAVVLLLSVSVHFAGPVATAMFAGLFLAGAIIPAAFCHLAGPILPSALSEVAAKLWLTVGLQSFDRAVFDETREGRYTIAEAEDVGVDVDEETSWYRLCWNWVGFTFDPHPDTFGEAGATADDVEAVRPEEAGDTSLLPEGQQATDAIGYGDMRGTIPVETDDETTYVRTDLALRRFAGAATGDLAHEQKRQSTDEYAGEGGGLSDTVILVLSASMGLIGVLLAVLL